MSFISIAVTAKGLNESITKTRHLPFPTVELDTTTLNNLMREQNFHIQNEGMWIHFIIIIIVII